MEDKREEQLKKFEYLLEEGKGILLVMKEGESINLDDRGMYSGSRIARVAIEQGVVEEVRETMLHEITKGGITMGFTREIFEVKGEER